MVRTVVEVSAVMECLLSWADGAWLSGRPARSTKSTETALGTSNQDARDGQATDAFAVRSRAANRAGQARDDLDRGNAAVGGQAREQAARRSVSPRLALATTPKGVTMSPLTTALAQRHGR
jgi:hypothetical protein